MVIVLWYLVLFMIVVWLGCMYKKSKEPYWNCPVMDNTQVCEDRPFADGLKTGDPRTWW